MDETLPTPNVPPARDLQDGGRALPVVVASIYLIVVG